MNSQIFLVRRQYLYNFKEKKRPKLIYFDQGSFWGTPWDPLGGPWIQKRSEGFFHFYFFYPFQDIYCTIIEKSKISKFLGPLRSPQGPQGASGGLRVRLVTICGTHFFSFFRQFGTFFVMEIFHFFFWYPQRCGEGFLRACCSEQGGQRMFYFNNILGF